MDTGARSVQVDLPAAMGTTQARQIADLAVLQQWRGREGISFHTLESEAPYSIGDWITYDSKRFRVREVEKFLGFNRIEASAWVDQFYPSVPLPDPGVSVPAPDLLPGTSRLMLVDLPASPGPDPNAPRVFAAAAGTEAGWRRATLSVRQGDDLTVLGQTADPAVLGVIPEGLPGHVAALADHENHPVLRVLHEGMRLPTGDGDPYSASAPVISVQGELISFGSAEFLGNKNYRLHSLLRGIGGTEHRIADHTPNAPWLLIEPTSLFALDPAHVRVGELVTLEAAGLADIAPCSATLLVEGIAIQPRSPVHGTCVSGANGDWLLSWKRRDRMDLGWQNQVDMPLSEDSLQFEIALFVGGVKLRSWQSSEEYLVITAQESAALQLPVMTPLQFEIRQIGRHALSKPLLILAVA
jgi:hypothetical protein